MRAGSSSRFHRRGALRSPSLVIFDTQKMRKGPRERQTAAIATDIDRAPHRRAEAYVEVRVEAHAEAYREGTGAIAVGFVFARGNTYAFKFEVIRNIRRLHQLFAQMTNVRSG